MYYFDGIQEFRSVVNDLKDDFKQLIGNTRIMFAMKKGSSIGNSLVRNKALSTVTLSLTALLKSTIQLVVNNAPL